MDQPLIIVSSDSHAGMPKELWPDYLEARFHDLIPRLHEDNEVYPIAISLLTAKKGTTAAFPGHQEAHRTGWHGLHDPVLRLADMDREGVAAELIYHGDFRLGDLFHNTSNRRYPLEVWDAGARAWNRWAADTFGFAPDRFLVTGAIGPCTDMASTLAELDFLAEHGFAGTYLPGYMGHPDTPALAERYWEPFWSACEERDLAIVVHAGFGWEQGVAFEQLEKICGDVEAAAGTTEREALFAHADAVSDDSVRFFFEFANSVRSRRPLWQLTLGGVFDRHPGLKLVLTEIRVDWIPATLRHLDDVYEAHRHQLPGARRPSEYWPEHCLGGASFIHKAEVGMRHEIGIETLSFGRDFPHPESTWPHTREWLRDAFAGVPEDELRLVLGENAIRFLDLDRDRLLELARRIGPSVGDVLGHGDEVEPRLIESFSARGGYLKPAEGGTRIDEVDALLRDDLAGLTSAR
jgi:predicted TIM-barrel fold metal-dependent hydrolase